MNFYHIGFYFFSGLKSAHVKFPFHGNIYDVRGKLVFQGKNQFKNAQCFNCDKDMRFIFPKLVK